jgi:hypothetical protein
MRTENLDDEDPSSWQAKTGSSAGSPIANPQDCPINSILDAQLRLLRLLARLVADDLRKTAR